LQIQVEAVVWSLGYICFMMDEARRSVLTSTLENVSGSRLLLPIILVYNQLGRKEQNVNETASNPKKLASDMLVAFYLGEFPDIEGRMIETIWSWDYRRLEDFVGHCYVDHIIHLKMTDLTGSG
jgi:hypothetical protein